MENFQNQILEKYSFGNIKQRWLMILSVSFDLLRSLSSLTTSKPGTVFEFYQGECGDEIRIDINMHNLTYCPWGIVYLIHVTLPEKSGEILVLFHPS